MSKISVIEIIRLKHNYVYSYESYLEKKPIFIFSKRNMSSTIFDEVKPEINLWDELKNTFQSKIEICTEDNNFTIPSKLIFGNIEDWILFKYLAIIDSKGKNIGYDYYTIGERYGQSDATIVNRDFTIIKSLFCIVDNVKIAFKKFAVDFEKNISPNELDKIVKTYFRKIENIKREEFIIEQEIRQRKESFSEYEAERIASLNDSYYNDNLDMDQQSPEFWDNI